MHILLIEDDAKAASYILKGLNKLGDVGDHVVDGRDGLIQATTGNYDVIVVDRTIVSPPTNKLAKASRGWKKAPSAFRRVPVPKSTTQQTPPL
jgi:two-component system, OmpR family, response regulator